MKERAVVFGKAVDAYDRVRPSYPTVAIDHVLGLTTVTSAVEIGAGTGIATSGFARDGLHIVCIEPDPTMAGVLENRSLTGVDVVVSKFEDWPGPERPVDLVFAAQSWHWVDAGVGYAKVMGSLRPGGWVALMWNIQKDRYAHFEPIYQRHAPELLAEADARILRRDSDTWGEDLRQAGFEEVDLFTHSWSLTHTPAELRALYSTFSDHIVLETRRRESLLADLEAHVERLGGSVRLDYRTQVFTGRAPLTSPA